MNDFYLGLKFTLSYFTVIPVRFKKDDDLSKKEILDKMTFFLPFIGLILGTITVFTYSFLDSMPWLGAVISASLYMMLYGFIHTEAILDVVDAIYAKHGGKDAFVVIKEPTIGAMGLLYGLALVLIKIVALSYLLVEGFFLEFIAITIISRICIQFTIYFSTFRSSFISTIKRAFSSKSFFISVTLFSFVVFILTSLEFLWLIPLAFLFSILIVRFIKRNVGFLNGDGLGFILELIEIILFVLVCYLWL